MSKVRSISGFPEWLPEGKLVEDSLISTIRKVYESFGFTPIETPAVELLSTLLTETTAGKEIYEVRRSARSGDEAQEGELGLHFDLTVPFARYVAQHLNELNFPFKRYQLQKVWRGERPQKGRFREFYQFDLDVVARDELPLSCDSEIVEAMDLAFQQINIGQHSIKLNNRKILLGYYRSLGVAEEQAGNVAIVVDKLDKIGPDGVTKELTALGFSSAIAAKVLDFSKLKVGAQDAISALRALGVKDELFCEGQENIEQMLRLLPSDCLSRIELDLSLARGLAYYTGLIFEVRLRDYPDFGSVGGGGRYDNLASQFTSQKLPGVGASIGLTRLMDLILKNNIIQAKRSSPTQVLVAVYSEGERPNCNKVASQIRQNGLACEVYYKSPKLGKQIEYAEQKGVRYVLFVNSSNGALEVKDLVTKQQQPVSDLSSWCANLIK